MKKWTSLLAASILFGAFAVGCKKEEAQGDTNATTTTGTAPATTGDTKMGETAGATAGGTTAAPETTGTAPATTGDTKMGETAGAGTAGTAGAGTAGAPGETAGAGTAGTAGTTPPAATTGK